MNRSTKHQHVCSTFARHTKPTPQNQTLQKSCKRSYIQQPSGSNIFEHKNYTSATSSLCYAQTRPCPPTTPQYKRLDKLTLKFLMAVFMICLSIPTNAQKIISGRVLNKENKPIEFATVILKKDSTVISNCFTDSVGFYKLKVEKLAVYEIQFSYLNTKYKSIVDLTKDTTINITLSEDNTQLNEVTVISKSPTVERKIDRIIFNPNNLISTSGDNAYETIKKAPAVFADETGNISIRGLSGAGVMINGRLLQLSSEQIMDYLKSIASDEILRIEVITNPSSKYDAEGLSGLLNIVLKKSKKIGLNGNSTIFYEQTTYPKYGGNIDINYRTDKINLFGGTSLRDGKYFQNENIDNIYNRNILPYYYYEKGNRNRKQISNFNKLGLDYTINKNHVIGVRFEHSYTSKKGNQTNNSTFQKYNLAVDSLYNTSIDLDNYNNDISANLNYTATLDTAGQSITFDFDYSNFYQPLLSASTSTKRYNSLYQSLGKDIIFKNEASQKINIFSAKTDYSKQLSKTIWLETGIKYYFLKTDNNLKFYNFISNTYLIDNLKSSTFNYQESNLAFYANLYKQFNDKWSIQIGGRNENTFLKGSSTNNTVVNLKPNYSKIFPTLFIQYNKNDNNQFSLNYTKRINRPDYSNLNPFRYYTNPNSYIEGNPFLQPAITNSIDFSYTFKQKYFINAFLYLTDGQITQVPVLDPNTNSYKYLSVNLDKSYNTGINTYLPFQIKKWWQTALSITVGFNGINSLINNSKYNYNNFNFQVITNNQFTLSQKSKFFGELNFIYQPKGSTQGLFILGKLVDLSFGVKKVFKDKKSALSLNVTDVFNAAYITATVDKIDQYSYIHGNYDKRGIRLSFSYKFGKSTIEKPREKKSSIEDETKRIKL
jgi:outer membrane receptor protein involved in Fe transport